MLRVIKRQDLSTLAVRTGLSTDRSDRVGFSVSSEFTSLAMRCLSTNRWLPWRCLKEQFRGRILPPVKSISLEVTKPREHQLVTSGRATAPSCSMFFLVMLLTTRLSTDRIFLPLNRPRFTGKESEVNPRGLQASTISLEGLCLGIISV